MLTRQLFLDRGPYRWACSYHNSVRFSHRVREVAGLQDGSD